MSSWVTTFPVTDAETLFAKLVETIDACLVEPGHYVIIEAPDNRFVQALVDPEGVLVIETVAAQFLTDTPRPLTPADEAALLRLGWRPPSEHSPNWHRVFVDPWPWPAPLAAEMTARTLLSVHHAYDEVLNISLHPANATSRVNACDGDCHVPFPNARR